MDEKVRKWRDSGEHLPKFMRDFHDQKDTFKTLHDVIDVEKHEYAKDVSWVVGHCYVIDLFLWHMARHGYVLRKTNKQLPFDDIAETNSASKEARSRATAAVVNQMLAR